MSKLRDLANTPDALLALEPEDLAVLVLQDIVAIETRGSSGGPNRRNFMGMFPKLQDPPQQAIMEAWAWLETSGCIAQRPTQEEGWVFVTRRGQQLAQSSDTTVFTRSQPLPRHLLHPRI